MVSVCQTKSFLGITIFTLSILGVLAFVAFYILILYEPTTVRVKDNNRNDSGGKELVHQIEDKSPLIENFYTYFVPMMTVIKNDSKPLPPSKNPYNPKNYYFDVVRIGISRGYDSADYFVKVLSELLLSTSNMLNMKIVYYDNSADICHALNSHNLELGLVPTPTIVNATMGRTDNFPKPLNNMRFISNLGHRHIFLITTVPTKIQTLKALDGKRVGAGLPHSTTFTVVKDIYSFASKNSPLTSKFINVDHNTANEMLRKGELDAFFYTDLYPNHFLARLIETDPNKKYLFLPIEVDDQQGFVTNYYYYRPSHIDLNLLPKGYLPVNVNKKFYFEYKPYLESFKFNTVFLGNDEMPNNVAKKISETIFNNVDYFNKLILFKFDPLQRSDFLSNLINVPIQEGTYQFMKEKGYISTNPNPECIERVGKGKCDLPKNQRFSELT